jgi:hypothetical protein
MNIKLSKRDQKMHDAMMECYVRLFANSTPPGDFNKMLDEAELNAQGRKIIPFMDYEIEEEPMNQIIEDVAKEFKIKKIDFTPFRNGILMGCSPKTKYIK